ncbi:MAG: PDZ domain-containing protein, partial [Paracoccaceae bacterium]
TEVGKEVRVIVFRNGQTETLRVTLGRREEAEGAVPASVETQDPVTTEFMGLTISDMTDELREQLGLPSDAEGLVVGEVSEESEAFEKGLRAGDIIIEAGQEKVATVRDLEERVENAKDAGRKSLLLLVRRAGDPRFVALSLDAG